MIQRDLKITRKRYISFTCITLFRLMRMKLSSVDFFQRADNDRNILEDNFRKFKSNQTYRASKL